MAETAAYLEKAEHIWPTSGIVVKFSLRLSKGSIHALMGENGAGKTTAGHIFSGVLRPGAGTMHIGGQVYDLAKRRGALLPDIGLIRQRSIWPPNLLAWEAAATGLGKHFISSAKHIQHFKETAQQWSMADLDPRQPVGCMDAAALQRAQFVAALMRGASILVLDEAAPAWEEGRSHEFYQLMDALRNSGRALLLITHRLEDVFQLSDEVTVMSGGAAVKTVSTADTDRDELIETIFGRQVPAPETGREKAVRSLVGNRIVLKAENMELRRGKRMELEGVNIALAPGQIAAVAGQREHGLATLEEVLTGFCDPSSGDLRVMGMQLRGPGAFRAAGLRYIPAQKAGHGAALAATAGENLLPLMYKRLARGGLLTPYQIGDWSDGQLRNSEIAAQSGQRLETVSEGNIQKLIIQRELMGNFPLLIAADPAWGLDEHGQIWVYEMLKKAAERGAAILLLASNLDEALTLADTLAVVYDRNFSFFHPPTEWKRQDAMKLISGADWGELGW